MAWEEFEVVALAPVKADGRVYQPGDIVPGAQGWKTFPHLVSTGTLAVVRKPEDVTGQARKSPRDEPAPAEVRRPEPSAPSVEAEAEAEFSCEDCDFVAKSAAGLAAHARKHEDNDEE